ncbi:inositol monophosphatase [Nocardioides marmoriginsengisoli]|uniref:Inositol-1-monophosphatase n=1 Tax=Nocardioides marmoriginsengisoli TaxID=661483 RepID=A0A3N0CQ34_9ACTN|nr:inositol monophosphatase family protein [Nocardioides marmoriginsengisoli]RNL65480.1 inositol monophosphatase [Nocardioides marmoriginsengisoli]
MTDLEELRILATAIAREAGELILAKRAAGVRIAETKSSATDIVTEADRASEALIQDRVLAARPDDGLLGEEGASREGASGVRWIIDPIDGTVNYAHGLPHYAVAIGIEVDGVPAVGVVHAPALGLEYSAALGGGAWCNGRPLRVADPVPLGSALVGTGFSYERALRVSQTTTLTALLPRIADIRRNGSCALDLCAVADGLLDGYVEEGIGGPWDYVGGRVIAHEAGADSEVLTGVAGRILVVAAPAGSYPGFRAAVEECGFVESGASKERL